MPATRGKFYRCGHRGFGGSCKRCEMADRLEKMIEKGELLVTNKRLEKPRTWTKKEMADEAKRLRGPQERKNKSGYKKSKSSMSLADQVTDNEGSKTAE